MASPEHSKSKLFEHKKSLVCGVIKYELVKILTLLARTVNTGAGIKHLIYFQNHIKMYQSRTKPSKENSYSIKQINTFKSIYKL